MRKGKDIIGKSVVTYDSGQKVATVKDLIFDRDDNSLLGFLIEEAGWFSSAKILPLDAVTVIGSDAIIIPDREAIRSAKEYPNIYRILENNNILNGTRVMTTDGRNLGRLVDLYFDDRVGTIAGYETSDGLFADAYSGRSFVPAPKTIKIGKDVAFVPPETVDLMAEQVGGIKAAMLTAGEKMQSTAQVAGEKIKATAQVASEQMQSTAQITGDKLQVAGQTFSAKVTDAIVDRTAQKDFVVGKVAQQTVNLPNGEPLVLAGTVITSQMVETADRSNILDRVYRAAGGNLSAPLGERVNTAVAGLTVDRVQGRRAQRAVYSSDGYIIVAQGQIVTLQTIERAKTAHRESALLDAVGLSAPAAAQSQASALTTVTADRLKTTTAVASDRLQEGATNVWERLKETTNELQGRSAQAIEAKRIKGALGRPTTRVILDRHDGVILNVGELIGHKAIEAARAEGVLDLLLDSVYTGTPQLSLDEMRASEKGKAALS
ncbi:PRC-barrel domain-containing protein [Chamaesiphon sp. VAR_69_metabat_338]|uniref:PRC-barrel domain-containing protein n=1 Tax=Chamaesiphon sp. VAR_69_metabat_338 TaxID=2964704 RepID=UPI00286E9A0F|nr:PRC-barrel domain-containing protein [Chamaesiphon sp. VAR_69_metabat_338]